MPPQNREELIKCSLIAIAQDLFPRLGLAPHRELLESCEIKFEPHETQIYCPCEDIAEGIYEGGWAISEDAAWCSLPDTIALYLGVKDQGTFYREFRVSDRQNQIKRRLYQLELTTMQDLKQVCSNASLILPQVSESVALTCYYQNFVLHSPERLALALEATQRPIAVSPAYADYVAQDMLEVIGDPENASRWFPGELERMQRFLERDGFLQGFEYLAYEENNSVDPFIWVADFQRVNLGGDRFARLVRHHRRTRKNIVISI